MHVANQPSPLHIAHDVLNRRECLIRRRLVVHRQENAGEQLDKQHHEREYAKYVPEIKILRRVVLGYVVLHRLRKRKPIIDPLHEAALGRAYF